MASAPQRSRPCISFKRTHTHTHTQRQQTGHNQKKQEKGHDADYDLMFVQKVFKLKLTQELNQKSFKLGIQLKDSNSYVVCPYIHNSQTNVHLKGLSKRLWS